MLENSLAESGHIGETIKTEMSKIAPKGGANPTHSMFLSSKPSKDMLMDDSAMLSI